MAYRNDQIDYARRRVIEDAVAGSTGYRFVNHGGIVWAEPIFAQTNHEGGPAVGAPPAGLAGPADFASPADWRLDGTGKASETLYLRDEKGAWRRAGQVFNQAGGYRLERPGTGQAFFPSRGALERFLVNLAA